jgi:hypothetical protein
MLEDKTKFKEVLNTVLELFNSENDRLTSEILNTSESFAEPTYYDNWNGGTTYYTIYVNIPVDLFVKNQTKQEELENSIKQKFILVLRPYDSFQIGQVMIIPKSTPSIDWSKIVDFFDKDQFLSEIEYLKNSLIDVATGKRIIQDINDDYKVHYTKVSLALRRLGVDNPNLFEDLWQWYARWKKGDLNSYNVRRIFIIEMYQNLSQLIQESDKVHKFDISVSLTGWDRIERTIREINSKIILAKNEEQFQSIGLLCRETIISLGQAIFNEEKHQSLDGVNISNTDAKRMLDAYIMSTLAGKENENLRKYARASTDLANELTHKRTADSRDAKLCSAATIALVNLIGIIEGR